MKLKQEDKDLLKNLCIEHNVSYEKVLKLLTTVKEYEFKDRRTGIYDALKTIVLSDLKTSHL